MTEATGHPGFVRDAWYCAGWSREIGPQLRRETMLGEDIVLWRRSDGTVAALEDMCPHRFLPLSAGRLVGDAVQCGYHGMTFDGSGACVRVPGQDAIPERARVRRYPVAERHGVVWVWTGDPARADESLIFDLPQLSMPGWRLHHGDALRIEADYMSVAENLCDPSHVSFVHPTTLGNAASEDVPVRTARHGDVVTTWRWIRDAEPVGFFKAFGGFTGNVDRWHYYHLHAPAVAAIDFGSADAALGLGEDERDRGVRLFAVHLLTPVDERTTIDRWMHARNTALDVEGVEDRMDALFRAAFDEDKAILEAIRRQEERRPGRRPVDIAIDLGPKLYRQIVARMIALESERADA
jgi:vanillate O-demethylase monooxygenase subunit